MNRQLSATPAGTPANSAAYTSTGLLKTESNSDYTAAYTYDTMGRVSTITAGNIESSFTYDLDGKRLSYTVKVGGAIKLSTTYTYDILGRLQQVKENGRIVGTYTYNANGTRATLTNGNGINVSYQYNLANLPTSLANKQGSSVISSYNYAYQLDGNQISKTDNSGKVTTYSYDGLGRLKSEAETGGVSIAYQYDTFSNRKKLTATGSDVYTVDYTYDKNNRLMSDIKTKGQTTETTTYDYDKNGNQIFKNTETLAPAGTTQSSYALNGPSAEFFEYDGFGRMVSAFAGGKNMQYKYRPDGLRLSKSDGVSTTTHIWDGQNMAMELDGTGAMTAKYVRGINLLESEDKAGTRKTYMYNAHGDVVQLTGTTGQVLWKYDYDAFGVERPIAGQDPELDKNTWRYCGEYFDTETGTVYLRARNYEPMTGRFVSEDSVRAFARVMPNKQEIVDPLSINLYAYCYNNPVLYQDPSGNFGIVTQVGQQVGPKAEEVVNVAVGVVAAVGSAVILSLSTPGDFTGRGYPNPKYLKKPKVENIPLHDENKNVGTNKVDAKTSKQSGKEKANDIPSWAKGTKPKPGQSGSEYAKEQMDAKYGENQWQRSGKQGKEYSELQKYGDRGGKSK